MFGIPPFTPNFSCGCNSDSFNKADGFISSALSDLSRYVSALTTIAGFGNYGQMSDTDKRYLWCKTHEILKTVSSLEEVFKVDDFIVSKNFSDLSKEEQENFIKNFGEIDNPSAKTSGSEIHTIKHAVNGVRKIVICGSLTQAGGMYKLKKKLYSTIQEIHVTIPNDHLSEAAYKKYIERLINCDLALIFPKKELTKINDIYLRTAGLDINGVPSGIACVSSDLAEEFAFSEDVSYEKATVEHFDVPYYTINDPEYVSSGDN